MNTVSLTGVLQRFEDKGNWVKGSIRVQNNMKNQKTDKYENSFYDFKMFGKTAELFLRFHGERTGKNIAITGNLVQETWEKDGQKRSNVVIVVQNCDLPPFDDSKPAASNQNKPASSNGFGSDPFAGGGSIDLSDSDLPF